MAENLLPLSTADTLSEAWSEWHVTGDVIDHEEAVEICQLCEHEQLRYHFLIENRLTGNDLWVGSQCITRFGIAVFDAAGRRITGAESVSTHLLRLRRQHQQELWCEAMWQLSAIGPDWVRDVAASAAERYEAGEALSPKQAAAVIGGLRQSNIGCPASPLRVSLRRIRYVHDVCNMEDWQLELVWPHFTPAQQRRVREEREGTR